MGEFDEAERWLDRAWEIAEPHIDPATAVLLHVTAGMLHAGRGQHEAALGDFTAAAQAQSLLTGVHTLAPLIAGWLAATQARLGMTEEASQTLDEFSGNPDHKGATHNARAVICMAVGDPDAALDALRELEDDNIPVFTLVETHLLTGLAHLSLGDRNAAAAAAELALAAAEPDRLLFSFAMTESAELVEAIQRHETAHGALLADILDLLRDGAAPSTGGQRSMAADELSPSELRVLRYLPTNLTRPEIARELYVSVNTVNTHIRNIYAKLGANDRSTAVQQARELRLLSSGLSRTPG